MTPRIPPPPAATELQAMIERLVAEGMTRTNEIKDRLPPEMQVSAEQIQGILDDVFSALNVQSLLTAARADLFRLISTGHSTVKHDPVNLA